MNTQYDIIIIGGGAAGFFTAINIKEKNPDTKIAILEKGNDVLQKVKISGGGRCNLTNACNNINDFVKNYPRGEKELRSCFQQFSNLDTMLWFESRGVVLKTESDGRVFPNSDNSQTIIDLFLRKTKELGVIVKLKENVEKLKQIENDSWEIKTQETIFHSKKIVITTGSNSKIWQLLSEFGYTIIKPVPSLFTFQIEDEKLHQLMGISQEVTIKVKDSSLMQKGKILITHWGLSGPAILKLSSYGAVYFSESDYKFIVAVNWLIEKSYDQTFENLKVIKLNQSKKNVFKNPQFGFTHRLWEYFINLAQIPDTLNFADISKTHLQNLAQILTNSNFSVNGKSTFKDEFVTAGGIDLKEINFKTMESKKFPNMYFAGEILNIDAITGGFNFQNVWTGAWLVSESLKNG